MKAPRRLFVAVCVLAGCHPQAPPRKGGVPTRPAGSACFEEQVRIERYCVDKYEGYVVELGDSGEEHPHSPYDVVGDARIRAKVAAHVVPQAYISQIQASQACANAGKRLCTSEEYVRACRGPDKNDFYPYGGQKHNKGICNEGKGSFVLATFGQDPYKLTYANFNDPRLNQIANGLAKTGTYDGCVSPDGAFDMVGNVHEWVADPADAHGRGRFRGGWYGDAERNLPGCLYVTSAHELTYHDYSTGFRCCADAVDP
jgi:hypothetical protein